MIETGFKNQHVVVWNAKYVTVMFTGSGHLVSMHMILNQ